MMLNSWLDLAPVSQVQSDVRSDDYIGGDLLKFVTAAILYTNLSASALNRWFVLAEAVLKAYVPVPNDVLFTAWHRQSEQQKKDKASSKSDRVGETQDKPAGTYFARFVTDVLRAVAPTAVGANPRTSGSAAAAATANVPTVTPADIKSPGSATAPAAIGTATGAAIGTAATDTKEHGAAAVVAATISAASAAAAGCSGQSAAKLTAADAHADPTIADLGDQLLRVLGSPDLQWLYILLDGLFTFAVDTLPAPAAVAREMFTPAMLCGALRSSVRVAISIQQCHVERWAKQFVDAEAAVEAGEADASAVSRVGAAAVTHSLLLKQAAKEGLGPAIVSWMGASLLTWSDTPNWRMRTAMALVKRFVRRDPAFDLDLSQPDFNYQCGYPPVWDFGDVQARIPHVPLVSGVLGALKMCIPPKTAHSLIEFVFRRTTVRLARAAHSHAPAGAVVSPMAARGFVPDTVDVAESVVRACAIGLATANARARRLQGALLDGYVDSFKYHLELVSAEPQLSNELSAVAALGADGLYDGNPDASTTASADPLAEVIRAELTVCGGLCSQFHESAIELAAELQSAGSSKMFGVAVAPTAQSAVITCSKSAEDKNVHVILFAAAAIWPAYASTHCTEYANWTVRTVFGVPNDKKKALYNFRKAMACYVSDTQTNGPQCRPGPVPTDVAYAWDQRAAQFRLDHGDAKPLSGASPASAFMSPQLGARKNAGANENAELSKLDNDFVQIDMILDGDANASLAKARGGAIVNREVLTESAAKAGVELDVPSLGDVALADDVWVGPIETDGELCQSVEREAVVAATHGFASLPPYLRPAHAQPIPNPRATNASRHFRLYAMHHCSRVAEEPVCVEAVLATRAVGATHMYALRPGASFAKLIATNTYCVPDSLQPPEPPTSTAPTGASAYSAAAKSKGPMQKPQAVYDGQQPWWLYGFSLAQPCAVRCHLFALPYALLRALLLWRHPWVPPIRAAAAKK